MQSGTSILTTSDILGALRTAWAARRLVVERSLTGESAGKSGAAVALVDVEIDHPRHSGLAVLKIEQKNQWGEPSEHARHIKARALSADFSRIIPEVIVRHETGEWDATLYNVVEGGLRFTNTLKHRKARNAYRSTRKIACIANLRYQRSDAEYCVGGARRWWRAELSEYVIARLSFRVALTRNLLFAFSLCNEKQIPRRSFSG